MRPVANPPGRVATKVNYGAFSALAETPQASPYLTSAPSPLASPMGGYYLSNFEPPPLSLAAQPAVQISSMPTMSSQPIPIGGRGRSVTSGSVLDLIGTSASAASSDSGRPERLRERANTTSLDDRPQVASTVGTQGRRLSNLSSVQEGQTIVTSFARGYAPQVTYSVAPATTTVQQPRVVGARPTPCPITTVTTVIGSPMASPQRSPSISLTAGPIYQTRPVTSISASPVTSMTSSMFTRQISGDSCVAPSSPSAGAWTVVQAPQRRKAAGVGTGVAVVKTAAAPSSPKDQGDAVDLYYDQKELFMRGHTRDLKQSRSFKAKKKTDYQVDKRRQQSERDKAANLAAMGGDMDDDDW
eukprot:TRINITY_DN53218_c0_g1_i1.p1 TRINITY_DN53218_c0_g1~~TRINITY_DN53218_c0_g1_i1.p1  ORF type:complete len:357 (-),score=61.01 TRINITY_DN53218_c0_g1_i1:97-1167(-)